MFACLFVCVLMCLPRSVMGCSVICDCVVFLSYLLYLRYVVYDCHIYFFVAILTFQVLTLKEVNSETIIVVSLPEGLCMQTKG